MRMAELDMDERERRQAEEWAEYLNWHDTERELNYLREQKHGKDSTGIYQGETGLRAGIEGQDEPSVPF